MIDAHCHLNHEDFVNDLEQYIRNAQNFGVRAFLVVGWDYKSSLLAVEIANKYNNVFAAVGIHPCDSLLMEENDLEKIEVLINNKKVVCIGEIGLDFYWNKEESEKEIQKKNFIKQIELANKYNLPVSIHSRDASEETLKILKNNTPKCGGVMHCYSSGPDMLDEFLKLGLYFGFGGPITFKNAVAPKESVKRCPIEKLLIETDSPYLTPVPFRGQKNKPEYVRFVFDEVSKIKEIDSDTLNNFLESNFERLFKVKII